MIVEERVGDGELEAALLAVEVGSEDLVGVKASVTALETCLDSSKRSRNS